MIDQAYKLREYCKTKISDEKSDTKIISITSGKGGTGKSYIAFYMAQLLALHGYKSLLVEFDFNLGSLALHLGFNPKNTLSDFFETKILFEELYEPISENFFVILGDNGKLNFPQNNVSNVQNFFSSINKKADQFDIIILDNSAGISHEIFETIRLSSYNLLVTLPDPVAIMDAYVIMKLMTKNSINTSTGVIINKCKTHSDGNTAFENLNKAASHFLNTEMDLIGIVPEDYNFSRLKLLDKSVMNNSLNTPILTGLTKSALSIASINQMANNNQPLL